MPPLKRNPKVKYYNKLVEEVGRPKANEIMNNEFIEDAKQELNALFNPFQNIYDIIVLSIGGYIVYNSLK